MMKKVPAPFVFVFCFCAALAAGHAWAAWTGLQAPPCPGSVDCYPWGAEGPAAGRWRYLSKGNYALVHGAQILAIIMWGGLLATQIAREGREGVVLRALTWLAAIGWAILFLV